jgi:serine protease Do
MKKLVSYVVVFVLGFAVCALILYQLGFMPGGGSKSVMEALTKRPAPPIGARDMNPIADAVAKVGPAVVNIHTMTERKVTNPFGNEFFGLPIPIPVPAPKQVQRGAGSGVIISRDGYILTNNHVVAGAQEIKVGLADGRSFKARVIGRDSKTDLAVVRVNANNLPAAQIGDSTALRAGDWAIAIGNPFDRGNSVSIGVVSATHRTEMVEEGKMLPDLIQTDAAINLGNSGGALANIYGQVVGINTAIISTDPGKGNIGIGFAIPINSAKGIAKQLIEKGKIVRPYLGVVVGSLTGELGDWYRQNGYKSGKGAIVHQIQQGSPADKGGLQQGDVIAKIDNRGVRGAEDVTKTIQKCKVGQVIRLTVWRNGKFTLIGAKLGEMPNDLQ